MVKPAGIDKTLLLTALLLCGVGLLMIYSSTMIMAKENYGDAFHFLKKQALWLALSLGLMLAVAFMRQPLYLNHRLVMGLLAACLVGLCLVFFFAPINHTYRWLRIGGQSVQPSEFAKIAVVLYLAMMLNRRSEDIHNPRTLGLMLLPVLGVEVLILKEPDFGTFLLILAVTLAMLIVAGLRLRYLLVAAAAGLPLLMLLMRADPMRMKRLTSFLHPEAYASTFGFQALQSVYAVGAGGLFGQGIGNSTQKLFFLPYAYTDFIYAIIAEELGLFGAAAVLALFLVFFFRGVAIARESDNGHTYLLVFGLTFMLVVQALFNISVTLGIVPTKGIPLPFISSGGTSLLGSLLVTGLILNVSRHRKMVFQA